MSPYHTTKLFFFGISNRVLKVSENSDRGWNQEWIAGCISNRVLKVENPDLQGRA